MKQARTISFLNMKGGVGKTSLIVNVAACLASLKQRVLVIDFDTQANASIWLMRLDRWNALSPYPEKFLLQPFVDTACGLPELVQKDVVSEGDGPSLLPGLDLIPSSFDLMDLEHDVPLPPEGSHHRRFWRLLQPLLPEYDFILFDCPPSFSYATRCALFASREILVPANPDALSIIGFNLMISKLEKFRQKVEAERREEGAPTCEIAALALNAVKQGTRIDVPVERLDASLKRFQQKGQVPKSARILSERVRHSVSIGRSVLLGKPAVLMPREESNEGMVRDYLALARAIQQLKTTA
jgi:chromosome partitioning protein